MRTVPPEEPTPCLLARISCDDNRDPVLGLDIRRGTSGSVAREIVSNAAAFVNDDARTSCGRFGKRLYRGIDHCARNLQADVSLEAIRVEAPMALEPCQLLVQGYRSWGLRTGCDDAVS